MARSPAKRFFGSLLFLLAAIAVLAFLFLIYADSINDDNIPFTDKISEAGLILAIALGVIILALIIMLLTRSWSNKAEVAEEAEVFFVPEAPAPLPPPTTEFEEAPEITIYDLRRVPLAGNAWSAPEVDGKQHPFYFPRSVTGGIYVNDYIPIDNHFKLLKLRTLLGGPYDPAFADTSVPTSRVRVQNDLVERAAPPPEPVEEVAAPPLLLQEVEVETLPEAPVVVDSGVYVDYPGDNHEVEDLEGIGPTYGARLREAGVHSTARLTYEDAGRLAERISVPRNTVIAWQQMAELVKVKGIGPQYAEALVRAGVGGIAELKRRSAQRIAQQVNEYLDALDTNVIGTKITPKRVEGWKDAAKYLKRIRLQVPAQ